MSVWSEQDYNEIRHLTHKSFGYGVAAGILIGSVLTFVGLMILGVMLGY